MGHSETHSTPYQEESPFRDSHARERDRDSSLHRELPGLSTGQRSHVGLYLTCILVPVHPQLWDIADYCLHKSCSETTPTVVMTPPPLKLAWRSHVSSIVTIDVAEETNVIVTASTDCTVCLWSHKGHYIGMETWRMGT